MYIKKKISVLLSMIMMIGQLFIGVELYAAMPGNYPVDSKYDIVIDNDKAIKTGKWNAESTSRGGYYGKGYLTAPKTTDAAITWQPQITTSGAYNIYVAQPQSKVDASSFSKEVPYLIKHAKGESIVKVNQRNNPGGEWIAIGKFPFLAGGDYHVQISTQELGEYNVLADAIKFEYISDESIPGEVIIDNSNAIIQGDTWKQSSYRTGYYGDDYHYTKSEPTGNTHIKWYPQIKTPGYYQIAYNQPEGKTDSKSIANHVKYTIYGVHENASVVKSHRVAGNEWRELATVYLDDESHVELNAADIQGGTVLADAMKFKYMEGYNPYDLLINDFSQDDLSEWDSKDPWGIKDSQLVVEMQDSESDITVKAPWKCYSAEVNFEIKEKSEGSYFGILVDGLEDDLKILYDFDTEQMIMKKNNEVIAEGASKSLDINTPYTLRVKYLGYDIEVFIDKEKVLSIGMEEYITGNFGLVAKGISAGISTVLAKTEIEPKREEGTYVINKDKAEQTIWGLGVEIQSDSIGSGNKGLPEAYTSVPHDLVQSERDRLYEDMLSGFRYLRLAGGLYYRGLDEEKKHLKERWPEQLIELRELVEESGFEGINFEFWSPTPYFKKNNSYLGNKDNTLKSYEPEFLQEFGRTIVEDLQYLEKNGLPISAFGLQNEGPHNVGTYPHCHYDADQYYKAMKEVIPMVHDAFPDIHIHSDSWGGQHTKGSKAVAADKELLEYIDAWTFHRIGADSNQQINNADNEFNKNTYGKDVYQNEYEYLTGQASDWRCINTAQSIMNWMTFENSPTWYWLHALKPTYNTEASGYSLGFWRPWDDAKTTDIEKGHWVYNYQNWNSIAGFLKYMPWDSVRYDVTEDTVRYDNRIMTWKTPDGKWVVALTNRTRDTYFTFNMNWGESMKFNGYRYTPQGTEEISLGSLEGETISPVVKPLSIEFWVQEGYEGPENHISLEGMILNQDTVQMEVGDTISVGENRVGADAAMQITYLPTNASQKQVIYKSDDESIASINQEGFIQGKKEGTTVIRIISKENEQIQQSFTVKVKDYTATEKLAEAIGLVKDGEVTVEQGASLAEKLVAIKVYIDKLLEKTPFTYSGGTTQVVYVEGDTYKVTFKIGNLQDEKIIKMLINEIPLYIPVESLVLNQSNLTLDEGKTYQLSAKILPENATNKDMVWESADPSKVEVNEDGVVTAKKAGEMQISVYSKDNKDVRAICYVKVTKRSVEIPQDDEPTVSKLQSKISVEEKIIQVEPVTTVRGKVLEGELTDADVKEILRYAEDKELDQVVLVLNEKKQVTTYTQKLPRKLFEDGKISVLIQTPNGEINIPKGTIDQEALKDTPRIEVSLERTGENAVAFKSNLAINAYLSIPYTLSNEEQAYHEYLVVRYLSEEGRYSTAPTSRYDIQKEVVNFIAQGSQDYTFEIVRKQFEDTVNSWAKEAIEMLAVRDIIVGTSELTYEPERNVSIQDFAALLTRLLGQDIDLSHYEDIKQPLIREDMMVMVAQGLMDKQKIELILDYEGLYTFKDISFISSEKVNAVSMLINEGIIYGDTNQMINPQSTLTREEAAVVIATLFRKYI